jgi:hypothetical protein
VFIGQLTSSGYAPPSVELEAAACDEFARAMNDRIART